MTELELIDESKVTPDIDAAIRRLLCNCFPKDVDVFSKTRHWHGCAPEYSVVHMKDGEVLGHIGIVVRDIVCDGKSVRVAGIQNLAVAEQMRGTGLSGALISCAMDSAVARQIEHGMLFCSEVLRRFYESHGWHAEKATIYLACEGESVPDTENHMYMVKELGAEPFPVCSGIDLNGPDW